MKKYILVLIILTAAVLRLYHLEKVPPSLYWDEISLGYNAYSILKIARDEHGKFLPVTNFGAFGDYKPPGYIYATVPSIAIFDLTEFAVRFPSAFFGILTVLTVYFLTKKLFVRETIALTAALFLAISPWHLQFSRAAFESNMALFFSTAGIYFFIKFKDKHWYIFPSLICFLTAMYTFTGQRLFVPFILIILGLQFKEEIIKNYKSVLLAILLFLVLFFPLFKFATQTIEGRLRFDEVTIFKDLKPINDSTEERRIDDFKPWANIIHNRRFFFLHEYLINYFDAFNPSFLFFKGDINPRLSPQTVGELYLFDLFLILPGIYFLIKNKHKYALLLFGWILISPLGPATARETPHALRMAHILPTFQIIAALGLASLYSLLRFKKSLIIFLSGIVALSIFSYLHFYYVHYPLEYSGEWQYGYKQMVNYVSPLYPKVDKVFVSDYLGRAYINFLFYLKKDPYEYLKTADVSRDNLFFYNVNSFDKFVFTNNMENFDSGNSLYVSAPGHLPAGTIKLKTVIDLNSYPVFDIGIKP